MRSALVPSGIFVLHSILPGCSNDPEPAVASSASAAATAPVDVTGYCREVCRRAAACGVERAEKVTAGRAHELALVTKARADQAGVADRCASACEASAPDAPSVTRAAGCVEQTSCETFERCLKDAAREAPREPAQ